MFGIPLNSVNQPFVQLVLDTKNSRAFARSLAQPKPSFTSGLIIPGQQHQQHGSDAFFLNDIGCACAAYHDQYVRHVRVRRLQCDEIWSFVGAKAKNTSPEKKAGGWGDTWTWTAIDADTKVCVSYLVGGRDAVSAEEFMQDCAARIRGRADDDGL